MHRTRAAAWTHSNPPTHQRVRGRLKKNGKLFNNFHLKKKASRNFCRNRKALAQRNSPRPSCSGARKHEPIWLLWWAPEQPRCAANSATQYERDFGARGPPYIYPSGIPLSSVDSVLSRTHQRPLARIRVRARVLCALLACLAVCVAVAIFKRFFSVGSDKRLRLGTELV